MIDSSYQIEQWVLDIEMALNDLERCARQSNQFRRVLQELERLQKVMAVTEKELRQAHAERKDDDNA